MKRFTALFLILLTIPLCANKKEEVKQALREHVYTLASDSLRGRKAATIDARRSAQYICNEFKKIGLEPYDGMDYLQRFRKDVLNGIPIEMGNVIGFIEGKDSKYSNHYIVIGAHFDHLGMNDSSADSVFNGADDNASGVAAMIEVAKLLKSKENDLKRSVVFVGFDGEELGLLGSNAFVDLKILPTDKIDLMISVDMVGYYAKSGVVNYTGVGTLEEGRDIVNDAVGPSDLNIRFRRFEGSVMTATDTQPFAKAGIPTLAVTTGVKSPYHKPNDEADGIDFDGLTEITYHLAGVAYAFSREEDVLPSGKVAEIHHVGNFKVSPGVTIGMGTSTLKYTTLPVNSTHGFVYNAGVHVRFRIAGVFGIKAEALYQERHNKVLDEVLNDSDLSGSNKDFGKYHKITLNSLTIPLSLSYRVPHPNTSPMGIGLSVKGYYSYLFSGKQDNEKIRFEAGNGFNRNNWGMGWSIDLYAGRFTFGLEYVYALTPLLKNQAANIKPTTSLLKVGYSF